MILPIDRVPGDQTSGVAKSHSDFPKLMEDLDVRRTYAILLTLGLVLGFLPLVGCQANAEGTSSSPAAPEATATPSNDSSASQRLIGTWDGAFYVNDEAPLDDFDEITINICRSIRMLVVFHPDDRLQMSASMTLPEIGQQTTETSGAWKVLAENGNEIRVQALDPEGEPEDVTVVFLDENSFTMTPPNELRDLGVLRFNRQ